MENEFKHEFEPGIGYTGKIVIDSTPSFWDKILKRQPHYEQVFIEVYDFKNNKLLKKLETYRVRKSRYARVKMAHSLRKQEKLAWEICKEHIGKEILFSTAIEDGVISDKDRT